MANTAIVPFSQLPIPSHIKKAIAAGANNLPDKQTVNQLSFRGKVWRQVIDGEERPLLNKDDEPVSTVHVVVLNHNKARSRAYYEGAYVEGKATPPACWSNDGETPDASIKEPQSTACAKCPHAVKGSKITPNGKETTACSVFKRLAVVPLQDLSCPPMLLRLAQTSVWDKNNEENEAKGYYAWDQYIDMLRARGATHTGLVATKIRFDSRMAYPKLVFAASRWLEDEEVELVRPQWESEDVLKLLNASEVAAATRKGSAQESEEESDGKKGSDEVVDVDQADDDDTPPPPKKVKKAAPVEDDDTPPPPKAKKAKAAPVEEDEEEAPPPPKAKKAKAAPVEDEEEEEAPPPPKKVKKAAPVEEEEEAPAPAAKKSGKKDDGLAALVDEFDD